jgi:hypothetical protein
MKLETFQSHFHNDVTVRTFFRLVPENAEETATLNQMTSLLSRGEGALKMSGVEKSANGAAGPTFWVPWQGFFSERS